MAIGDPVQWIIIGVIVLVIFLWGPQKIPDLAKAIGRARKEFDQASKDVQGMASGTPGPAAAPAPAQKSGDQMLIETARALGIATEGKTREQIAQEIVSRNRTYTPAI
jgi:sec-independent protein translocase protein TatA